MTTEALGGSSSSDPRAEGDAAPMERLGPYRLVQQLGEGGMGIVHLALDPSGRAVAVKLLRPSIAHDAQARQRLGREVEILQRVRHPRVAPVLDANLTADRPYVVTRYVPGPSLDEIVRQHGPMDAPGLHELGHGLAEAIEAIHAADVIHRDLKPGNVLMSDEGPVLIDFGIAHIADDVRITMTGLVMGTPGYLSPEVVEGAPVTGATDWWGWATTLAFAASGAPPFGRGPMDVVLSRVSRGDADLSSVDPRLTPLLYAALSPDPANRPHTAEVLDALARYAAGTPVTEALPAGWNAPRATVAERVDRRHTHVMPPLPPPVGPLSPDPLAGGPLGALGHDVPRAPVPRPVSPLPRYSLPPDRPDERWDQRWDDAADEEDPDGVWEVDTIGPGQPDPRIGRDPRSGTLVAVLVLLLGLTAAYPVGGFAAFLLWSLVARTADRAVTSLVVRRFHQGARRSDVPVAVLASPWHVVVAVLGTIVSTLLPAVVAVSVFYTTSLALDSVAGTSAGPASLAPLAAGMLCGVLLAWWGPGGTGLRRGSRSLVRGLTAGTRSRQIVVVGALVLTAVLIGVALANGGLPDWTPMQAPNPLAP